MMMSTTSDKTYAGDKYGVVAPSATSLSLASLLRRPLCPVLSKMLRPNETTLKQSLLRGEAIIPPYIIRRVFGIRLYSKSIKRRVLNSRKRHIPKLYVVKYVKEDQKATIATANTVNKSVKNEIFIDQALTLGDAFGFLNSDFFSGAKASTLEDIMELIGKLKPINFCSLIAQFAAAQSPEEKFALINAIAELYDLFWTPQLLSYKALLIQSLAICLSKMLRMFWSSDRDAQEDIWESQASFHVEENSPLLKILDYFGIVLPEDISDIGLKLLGFISVILMLVTGGNFVKIPELAIGKVVKRIQKFASTVKSFNMLVDGLPKLWAFTMSTVASLFGCTYESSASAAVKAFKDELLQFKIEVTELTEMMNSKPADLLMDAARLEGAFTAMARLDSLYEKLLKQEQNMSATKPIFDDIRNSVNALRLYVLNLKDSSCQKIEPFFLMLSGLPGIGKSQFVDWYIKAFTKALHEEFPHMTHMRGTAYNRTSTEKFWSGYTGQMFLVYDDFGQSKADNDHSDIMQIKHPNRTILAMSESKEKGRLFATFGIIGCTNQDDLNSSAIVKSIGALARRFEINVLVRDPHYDQYYKEHGCSPGTYEKEHYGEKAMIKNEHGQDIPYFCPNFSHLDFFRMATDHKDDATFVNNGLTNPADMVKLGISYFKYYHAKYQRSIMPQLDKAYFDQLDTASQVSDTRSHGSYEAALNEFRYADVDIHATSVAKSAERQTLIKDLASKIQWSSKLCDVEIKAGNHLPDLAEAKEWKKKVDFARKTFNENNVAMGCDFNSLDKVIQEEIVNSFYMPKQPEITSNEPPPLVVFDEPPPEAEQPIVEPELLAAATDPTAFWRQNQMEQELALPPDEPRDGGMFENQMTPAESTAVSFTEFSHEKGRIYAFLGSPGTGKTTLMRQIKAQCGDELQEVHANELHNFTVTKPAVYIEDISMSEIAFENARNLVMSTYDGHSPIKILFISFNAEMAKSRCKTEEEWDAFKRRLTPYIFEYQIKKRNVFTRDVYYEARDVEQKVQPYATMVKIIDVESHRATGKEVVMDSYLLGRQLALEVKNIKPYLYKEVLNVAVPYIGRNQIDPNFIVETTEDMYPFLNVMYNDPQKMISAIIAGKVLMVKGSYTEAVKIAMQFTSPDGPRPEFPEELDDFILLINNSQFRSEVPFVTLLKAKDISLVIMPKVDDPRVIRVFKVIDSMRFNSDGQVIDDEGGAATFNKASQITYSHYAETVTMMAPKIVEKLEIVEERVQNTSGFCSLFAKFPTFKTVFQVVVFLLKLGTAGLSIFTLMNIQKERLHPKYDDEKKKGKNKRGGRGAAKRFARDHVGHCFTRYVYDDLKKTYDDYASTAARKRGLVALVEDYCDIIDSDEPPVGDDGFKMFITTYNESIELMLDENVRTSMYAFRSILLQYAERVRRGKVKPESGKEPVAKATPGLNPIAELILEKQQDKIPKNATIYADEALLDPAAINMVNLVSGNTVEIGSCTEDGTFTRSVFGLMIGNKIGVTVSHFLEDGAEAFVKTYHGHHMIVSKLKILKKTPRLDLIIFEINNPVVNNYKCIVRHLPSVKASANKRISKRNGILVTTDRTMDGLVQDRLIRNVKLDAVEKIVSTTGTKDVFSYTGFVAGCDYESPINTQAGDCGSVVIVNDSSVCEKIVGIHNAANNTRGACTMLFKDYFDPYIRYTDESLKFKSIAPSHHKIPYLEKTDTALMNMPVVAKIPEVRYMPNKTKFWTSPLRLSGENPFQPSVLSVNDTRNDTTVHPYYNAIKKWDQKQEPVDEVLLDSVADDIGYWYASVCKSMSIQTKVLTKTEAVNAGKNYDINPLNRSSAPGYPWSKMCKKTDEFLVNKGGQEAYFGIDLTKKPGQLLNASIDDLINISRELGKYPKVTFAGNLKDEPIKVEKIYDVNTRSFAGAPLDYTIASRMYFATLQGAIHQARSKMPIQIGIDPTSMEWDFLMKRLLSISDVGFDLDFKNWDGLVNHHFTKRLPIIYNAIAKATNPDWDPEDDIIRINLNQSVVKPYLLVAMENETLIIQSPGGMASGSPRTADDNSLIHFMKFLYCLYQILIENDLPELANLTAIKTLFDGMIYGDDGAYAIHPRLAHIVNFETMQKKFTALGVICTPASKDGKIVKIMPVIEMEFLKRNTVKIGSHYYGALQRKTFYKMLGYCKGPAHHWYKNPTGIQYIEEDLVQTANSALGEAIFHGREFFDNMHTHLTMCLQRIGIVEVLPRYKDVVSLRQLPLQL